MAESNPVIGSRDDLRADISRCLRMRFSQSSCRRCLEICPHGAVSFDGGLSVRSPQCRGCLLCTTVCPVGALEARSDFSVCLAQLSKVHEPILGCLRTKESSHATLACLGGLAEEHLLVLNQTLAGRLTLNGSLCRDCPNRPMIIPLRRRMDALFAAGLSGSHGPVALAESAEDIHGRAEAVNRRSFLKAIRHSLTNSAGIFLSASQKKSDRPGEYGGKRIPIRRELLNSTRTNSSQELEARIGKHFDSSVSFEETCTRCQGCVAVCPTGALQTAATDETPIFDQSLCTGCGLCYEFCMDGGVRLDQGKNEG
jgi:Fe-S-cluster-containing hydrogenase component 2